MYTLELLITTGTIRMWHSVTYRCETTLNYGMERVWSVGSMETTNMIGIGYDEGTVIVKIIPDPSLHARDALGAVASLASGGVHSSKQKHDSHT